METISFKVENEMLSEIDSAIKRYNFGTRTEFVRSAIRISLEKYSKEDLIRDFLKYNGKSKVKTTNVQNRKTRERVSKELLKELEEKFKWVLVGV